MGGKHRPPADKLRWNQPSAANRGRSIPACAGSLWSFCRRASNRSIPACAGEPLKYDSESYLAKVYPRVCGAVCGVSATRMRRQFVEVSAVLGSNCRLPAWREASNAKHVSWSLRQRRSKRYPRVCGEACSCPGFPFGRAGLSVTAKDHTQSAEIGRIAPPSRFSVGTGCAFAVESHPQTRKKARIASAVQARQRLRRPPRVCVRLARNGP